MCHGRNRRSLWRRRFWWLRGCWKWQCVSLTRSVRFCGRKNRLSRRLSGLLTRLLGGGCILCCGSLRFLPPIHLPCHPHGQTGNEGRYADFQPNIPVRVVAVLLYTRTSSLSRRRCRSRRRIYCYWSSQSVCFKAVCVGTRAKWLGSAARTGDGSSRTYLEPLE